MNESTSFENLPLEIQQLVLSYLSPFDLIRCSLVCTNWKDAVENYGFWKRQFPIEDAIIMKYIKEVDSMDRKASGCKQNDELINGMEFQKLYSLMVRVIKARAFAVELENQKYFHLKVHQANHQQWARQSTRLQSEIESERKKLNKITYGAVFISVPFIFIALWMFSPTFSMLFWLISSLYQITSGIFYYVIPKELFYYLDNVIYGLFCVVLLGFVLTYYAVMCFAFYKFITWSKNMWQSIVKFFLGRNLSRLEFQRVLLMQRVSSEKRTFSSTCEKNEARAEALKQLQWQTEVQLDDAIVEASKALQDALVNKYIPPKLVKKPKPKRKKTTCIVM